MDTSYYSTSTASTVVTGRESYKYRYSYKYSSGIASPVVGIQVGFMYHVAVLPAGTFGTNLYCCGKWVWRERTGVVKVTKHTHTSRIFEMSVRYILRNTYKHDLRE